MYRFVLAVIDARVQGLEDQASLVVETAVATGSQQGQL
jgi:hypothetical protein